MGTNGNTTSNAINLNLTRTTATTVSPNTITTNTALPSTNTSVANTTVANTTTPGITPSATSPTDQDTGLSAGEIAAIAVSAAVVLVIVLVFVSVVIRKRRRPKKSQLIYDHTVTQSSTQANLEPSDSLEYVNVIVPTANSSDNNDSALPPPLYINHSAATPKQVRVAKGSDPSDRKPLTPNSSPSTPVSRPGNMNPVSRPAVLDASFSSETTKLKGTKTALFPKTKDPNKMKATSPRAVRYKQSLANPSSSNDTTAMKVHKIAGALINKQQTPPNTDQPSYVEILPDIKTIGIVQQRKALLPIGWDPSRVKAPTPLTDRSIDNQESRPADKSPPQCTANQPFYLEILSDLPVDSSGDGEEYSYMSTELPNVRFATPVNRDKEIQLPIKPPTCRQDSEISVNYYNIPEDSSYQNVNTKR